MEWDPRDYNAIADHAANYALDSGRAWQQRSCGSCSSWAVGTPNLHLCVDGARRGDGNSAVGMALFAFSPVGERELVYRAGKILGNLPSAFVAELLALEWGLEILVNVISGGVSHFMAAGP